MSRVFFLLPTSHHSMVWDVGEGLYSVLLDSALKVSLRLSFYLQNYYFSGVLACPKIVRYSHYACFRCLKKTLFKVSFQFSAGVFIFSFELVMLTTRKLVVWAPT